MKKYRILLLSLLLIVCIGAPISVEYWLHIPSGKGDWLSFWGSYLGIIPSGLIAYFVAKYQIDKEHEINQKEKDKGYLPYFNIIKKDISGDYLSISGFSYSSLEENIPIKKIDIQHRVDYSFSIYSTDILFPRELYIFSAGEFILRDGFITITCKLLNGTEIFYIFGEGIEGAHFAKVINGEWEQYVLGKNNEENNLAWEYVKGTDFL